MRVDDGRAMGKAVARGKVKAMIVAIEATVNEASRQCKNKISIINKTIQYFIIAPPPPRLKIKLLLFFISWHHNSQRGIWIGDPVLVISHYHETRKYEEFAQILFFRFKPSVDHHKLPYRWHRTVRYRTVPYVPYVPVLP